MRYWRENTDGSYVICLDGTYHQDCPVIEGYVRADLHAAYLISPPKILCKVSKLFACSVLYFHVLVVCCMCIIYHIIAVFDCFLLTVSQDNEGNEESTECMLTFIAQIDPKGWIWQSGGYQDQFIEEFMLQVLDVRDALDSDRFAQVYSLFFSQCDAIITHILNLSPDAFRSSLYICYSECDCAC